jgi:hypothetical protein
MLANNLEVMAILLGLALTIWRLSPGIFWSKEVRAKISDKSLQARMIARGNHSANLGRCAWSGSHDPWAGSSTHSSQHSARATSKSQKYDNTKGRHLGLAIAAEGSGCSAEDRPNDGPGNDGAAALEEIHGKSTLRQSASDQHDHRRF